MRREHRPTLLFDVVLDAARDSPIHNIITFKMLKALRSVWSGLSSVATEHEVKILGQTSQYVTSVNHELKSVRVLHAHSILSFPCRQ